MHVLNPMKNKDYCKRYHRKLRRSALAYLGDRCVRCGFSDWRALQVDHVFGSGNQEHDSIGSQAIYSKVLSGEHDHEYQLLCANCNWIKRYENNEHGPQ